MARQPRSKSQDQGRSMGGNTGNVKAFSVDDFASNLAAMEGPVDWFLSVSNVTVETLRRTMDGIIIPFENAEAAYAHILDRTGSHAAAQSLIEGYYFSVTGDMQTVLASTRQATNALISTYSGMVGTSPGSAAPAFYFDTDTERHVDIIIPAGQKAILDADFQVLADSLDAFTPE